ncbi:MAG: acyl-CoA dehydratase activase [Caldisericia bacterium]
MKNFVVGIDLGSRAVKGTLIDTSKKKLVARSFADAGTNPKCVAESIYSDLLEKARITKCDVGFVTTTGYGRYSPDFSDKIATEITCHALGVKTLIPDVKTIIDIGGQDSKAIFLDDHGQIKDFIMNDRCAAGTGRFFEVVSKILETDSHGIAELAMKAGNQTEISSMCVVFAESEVIGLLAKDTPREDIAAEFMLQLQEELQV